MKRIPLSEFQEHGAEYVEELTDEGFILTCDGKAVARVTKERELEERDMWRHLGTLKGRVKVDPNDDLLSTGVKWDASS